jgi:hypothetical protein
MLDWQASASVEIRQLYGRYFSFVDRNEARKVGELFTEDGMLISEVMRRECSGRDEIVAYIDELRSSWTDIRIHIAQPSIELIDERRATGTCYFSVWSPTGWIYSDEFLKSAESWLFSRRSIALGAASSESRAEQRS